MRLPNYTLFFLTFFKCQSYFIDPMTDLSVALEFPPCEIRHINYFFFSLLIFLRAFTAIPRDFCLHQHDKKIFPAQKI